MEFKQYLVSQGLSEEQAAKIIEGMPAQKMYLAGEENLDVRYAKLKQDHDQVKSDLTAASKLVNDLKKENTNVEALQSKIKDYEAKVTTLEAERAKDRKTSAIKEALTKAGASDIEYMSYKLGDLEMDKDGTIKDLDSKIKDLQKTNPTFFKAADPAPNKPVKGYTPIDNKLPNGSSSSLDINAMSIDEINANWDAIKQQNKK